MVSWHRRRDYRTYNSKPSEQHRDQLVQRLKEEHKLSQETMVASPLLVEMGDRVHSGEETTVEPSTALQNELGHAVGNISLTRRGLDILEQPAAVALGDDLEAQNSILGEIHVGCENTGIGTVHLLSSKVSLQRPLAVLVVLQGYVPIGRKRTRQDGNEPERRLQRLVEDVGDLVLEVLSGDQRVQQLLSMRQHDLDFTACASAHGLHVKRLPQVVDGVPPGLRTRVKEHADIGVQDTTEGLEEPTVGVDLLLVLLLQAEEHLDRGPSARLEMHLRTLQLQAYLRGVLVKMGRHVLAVDLLLGNPILVNTQPGQHCPSARVDLRTTVADHADNNLLPRVFAPSLAVGTGTHVLDILEHTDQSASEEEIVLVVHGDDDEELRVPGFREKLLAQGVALLEEIRRVAGRRRVPHMGKLVASRRFSVRDLAEQLRCDGTIKNQIAIE